MCLLMIFFIYIVDSGVDLNFAMYVEKHGVKAIGVVRLVNDTG